MQFLELPWFSWTDADTLEMGTSSVILLSGTFPELRSLCFPGASQRFLDPKQIKAMNDWRITKRVVDGLKPQSSEYAVWDAKLTGFGVRVRPSGAMSYVVVYRAGNVAPFGLLFGLRQAPKLRTREFIFQRRNVRR